MKSLYKNFSLIFVVLMLLLSGSATVIADDKIDDSYKLKEVVILSRHNIRAPLSTAGSALDTATPHTWYEWSSNASELSLRGGILETTMGQYFRKWLEDEELFPENFRPENDEVRFYANAKQRTIATAQYFSSGLLPVANIDIYTNQEYDKMDPVFTPQLTFVSDKYAEDASKQMKELIPDLTKQFALLTDVVDLKESEDYKSGKISDLDVNDIEFILQTNEEPGMKGSLKTANTLADALILQYYEEQDPKAAAFGHDITYEDWQNISYIKDAYGDILFTAPLVCYNVSHPLLQEIYSELNNDERLFSFLCGHDSNIGSVLACLNVNDYKLPQAIESKTPIGSKLVFEKWQKNNEEYIRMRIVYNSVDQLRNIGLLSLDDGPVSYVFEIKDLQANDDGLYKFDDFMSYLKDAIYKYDEIKNIYCPSETKVPSTGVE